MKNKNTLINIAIAFFAIIAIVSGGILVYNYVVAPEKGESIAKEYKEIYSEEETKKEKNPENKWDKLLKKNSDIVGWIKIDDTKYIDYPILQTKNNEEYYLHRDLNKDYNYNGSIFASANSNLSKGESLSNVTVIYGHNMKTDKMFGQLTDYKNLDFLKSHNTIHFDTQNEDADWTIIGVCNVSTNFNNNNFYPYASNLSKGEFDEFLYQIRTRSYFTSNVDVGYNDNVLVLSTCDYEFDGERLIIVAVKNTDNNNNVVYDTNKVVLKPVEYYTKKGITMPSSDKIQANYAEVYQNN